MKRKAGAMLKVSNSKAQPKAERRKASRATRESIFLMQRVLPRRELRVIMASSKELLKMTMPPYKRVTMYKTRFAKSLG